VGERDQILCGEFRSNFRGLEDDFKGLSSSYQV
jgi:hypothetical protein